MSDIVVNTTKLRQYASRLGQVNNRLVRLDNRLDTLYRRVGLLGLWNLICADALTGYSWRLRRCQEYLIQTATEFEALENALGKADPANFDSKNMPTFYSNVSSPKSIWDKGQKITQRTIRALLDGVSDKNIEGILEKLNIQTGNDAEGKEFYSEIVDRIQELAEKMIRAGLSRDAIMTGIAETALKLAKKEKWQKFWSGELSEEVTKAVFPYKSGEGNNTTEVGILSGTASVETDLKKGHYKDGSILGDKDHLDFNVKQKEIKDSKKQVNEDEKWYDSTALLEHKTEDKLEGSIIHKESSGENGWGKGSTEADFLTGEVHASAAGGIYIYSKDKDGNTNRVFSPGVSAEVGASTSVLNGEASGRIGLGKDKNMLGVHGKIDAEVASAEAKAKFALNRKEVYAGASAEANVAKIEGTAGGSLLGTDIGVTAGAKVGVGAHAEAGFTDGKLKVDVGAAVGVGFDLGLEVDMSGTVDLVCDAAEAAWDFTTDVAESTVYYASEAWDTASNFAAETWENASNLAAEAWESAGNFAAETWDNASRAASEFADSTANFVSDAWSSAKDAAGNFWNAIF